MKTCIGIFLLSWLSASFSQTQVFVSFSMPEQLLKETLEEAARLKIPAVLNGLYHNSMPETMRKIRALAIQNPNLQIDPTAFERFGIAKVPALVVSNQQSFDVIYGNLTLEEGLRWIRGRHA